MKKNMKLFVLFLSIFLFFLGCKEKQEVISQEKAQTIIDTSIVIKSGMFFQSIMLNQGFSLEEIDETLTAYKTIHNFDIGKQLQVGATINITYSNSFYKLISISIKQNHQIHRLERSSSGKLAYRDK